MFIDAFTTSIEMARKQRNKGTLIFKHAYEIIFTHAYEHVEVFIAKFNLLIAKIDLLIKIF